MKPLKVPPQPIDYVEWKHIESLHANDYNPNLQAPAERELLIVSIIKNGWTAGVTIDDNNEIIDGFNRWDASKDLRLYEIYHGYVPTVRLNNVSRAAKMMATIRHNRARGTHHVAGMSNIIREMIEANTPIQQIMHELGMEEEEVVRLAIKEGIPKSHIVTDSEWSPSWKTE